MGYAGEGGGVLDIWLYMFMIRYCQSILKL